MTELAPFEAFRARVAKIRDALEANARLNRPPLIVRLMNPVTDDAGAAPAAAHAPGLLHTRFGGQSSDARPAAPPAAPGPFFDRADWPISAPNAKASVTLSLKMLERAARSDRRLGAEAEPPITENRPKTRADCVRAPRPCPFVSCKHNTYLEAHSNGSLQLNFPNNEIDELPTTCSLDVADKGGVVLDEVAAVLNLTRERVRQIEERALKKLAMQLDPELAT